MHRTPRGRVFAVLAMACFVGAVTHCSRDARDASGGTAAQPTEAERRAARGQRDARRRARDAMPKAVTVTPSADAAPSSDGEPTPVPTAPSPSAEASSAATVPSAEPSATAAVAVPTSSAAAPPPDACVELCQRAISCQLEQLEDEIDDREVLEQLREGMKEAERLCREKCDASARSRAKAAECLHEKNCDELVACVETTMAE
ncbi:MAG: hypothetical protein EXR75_13375 [Myxococcales bacterium]|nr:hypothetical protein [Myxococcales bacterium]